MEDITEQIVSYRCDVLRHARTLTNNYDDAQDLAQETMYMALKHKDRYRQPYNMRAWLLTICNNIHINENKKEQIRARMHERVQGGTTYQYYNENALTGLKSHLRETFALFVDGYTYKEIAQMLRVPIGTIKYRIHAARAYLINIYR